MQDTKMNFGTPRYTRRSRVRGLLVWVLVAIGAQQCLIPATFAVFSSNFNTFVEQGQPRGDRRLARVSVSASASTLRTMHLDVFLQGKLRALGRFLSMTSTKLKEANPTASPLDMLLNYDDFFSAGGAFLGGKQLARCACAMQDVSEALLSRRSRPPSEYLKVATDACSKLFPSEHVLALKDFLDGKSPPLAAHRALATLSRVLQGHADCVLGDSQNALVEAASALQSASRLFVVDIPRHAVGARERPRRVTDLPSLEDITREVESVALSERKSVLRRLVSQYHPDKHPGKEMLVLPIFMHAQKLREEYVSWV